MINLMVLHWGLVNKEIDVFGKDTFSGKLDPIQTTSRLVTAAGSGKIRALTGSGGQKPLTGRGGNG